MDPLRGSRRQHTGMQGFGESGSQPCRLHSTYSLHCSSFLGLPYRILIMYLVKPKKGTTMETIGIHRVPSVVTPSSP